MRSAVKSSLLFTSAMLPVTVKCVTVGVPFRKPATVRGVLVTPSRSSSRTGAR
eukprot:CAMPEP_0174871882 /NCGR_PEP_ID=MMETSP1114-20130205/72302_1 /TAXON_ID=312471 /ORGANISM="Neobodo designis, Strain CCAP 1951/1" /LENGTH=52 /DNA_ID=CAMNT_0016107173 /DNA_START=44 /DNA_END=198 /DNA_ORIENTATION=+